MDSVLISNQFPHRISLAQAAQMSGYHQDYLGQLCRLGKLRASKIGRNWYTTQSEIHSLLSNPAASDPAEFLQMDTAEESEPVEPLTQEAPIVTANYLISEVREVPIRLEQRPQAARSHHSLQTLVTRMRLDELRSDVLQVSGLVQKIATEQDEQKAMLMRHEEILQGRTDLREQYAPSLGLAGAFKPSVDMVEFAGPLSNSSTGKQPDIVWLWPALTAVVAIAAASLLIVGNMSRQEPQLSTVIYKPQGQPIEVIVPQVAGEQTAVPLQP